MFGLKRSHVAVGLLLLGMCIFAIAPYLEPGYFWSAHDARHDVYFLFEFDRAVQDGIWFPRWGPDFTFGYGYPFWVVYGPLASFVGELFHHFVGLDWTAAVEAVFALSIVLSAVGAYGFVRSWLGPRAGLLAAAVYVYAPYHLVDLYVRAALAESVALAILPFVFWAARASLIRPRLRSILALAASYALLMFTSNLVTLIFTPVLALYIAALLLYRANQAQPWRELSRESIFPFIAELLHLALPPATGVLLGLGLSAVFWIPALVESRYVNQTQWYGGYYSPMQHAVYPHQLFSPAWGFGISHPGPDDDQLGGLSYQIGAAPYVLAVLSLLSLRRARGLLRFELALFALIALGAIYLMLPASAWAWDALPIIPYAQFPWRYLTLALIALAVLTSSVVGMQEDASRRLPDVATLTLVAVVILGSYPYLQVRVHPPTPEQGPVSLAAMMRFQRTADEMTGVTIWVDEAQRPLWGPLADVYVMGQDVQSRADYGSLPPGTVLGSVDIGSHHEQLFFHVEGGEKRVVFNTFWFPGWKAYLLDGQDGRPVRELEVTREEGPLARLVVTLPEGEGYFLVRFEDTPLRHTAKLISLATVALAVALICVGLWIARPWERKRV